MCAFSLPSKVALDDLNDLKPIIDLRDNPHALELALA
jgi:hypothetical protein